MDILLTYHKQATQSFWGTRQSPSPAKQSTRFMWKSQYVPFDGIPFVNTGKCTCCKSFPYFLLVENNVSQRLACILIFCLRFSLSCWGHLVVNALASHQYDQGLIHGISKKADMWPPGWTGWFSVCTPVSPQTKTSETPPSVPMRETYSKLL